jgi:hypothetical protein
MYTEDQNCSMFLPVLAGSRFVIVASYVHFLSGVMPELLFTLNTSQSESSLSSAAIFSEECV